MCDNTLKQELNEPQVRSLATKAVQLRMRKLHILPTVTHHKPSRHSFLIQGAF